MSQQPPQQPPQQLSFFEDPPAQAFPRALYFFLWPDAPAVEGALRVMRQLQRQRVRMRQRQAPHRLHVTMCGLGRFIGQMPPRLIPGAGAAVANLKMAPFPIAFDRIHGSNGHLVLRPSAAAALHDFGATLRETLIRAGLRRWVRSRSNPHMTLSYAAEDLPELEIDAVTWTVRDFALVESVEGLTKHVHRGGWELHPRS